MMLDSSKILSDLKNWSYELGFQGLGVADLDLKEDFTQLENWIQNGYHGSMSYLEKNKDKRLDPSKFTFARFALSKLALLQLAPSKFEAYKFELLKFEKIKLPIDKFELLS